MYGTSSPLPQATVSNGHQGTQPYSLMSAAFQGNSSRKYINWPATTSLDRVRTRSVKGGVTPIISTSSFFCHRGERKGNYRAPEWERCLSEQLARWYSIAKRLPSPSIQWWGKAGPAALVFIAHKALFNRKSNPPFLAESSYFISTPINSQITDLKCLFSRRWRAIYYINKCHIKLSHWLNNS